MPARQKPTRTHPSPTRPEATLAAAWWSRPAEEILAALGSGAQGLSDRQARRSLREHGPNRLGDDGRSSPWRVLARQFASPLVLILLAGAVLSLALREWVDAAIILTIVMGSSLLGFAQEWRASKAVAQLRSRLTLNCRVWRDGSPQPRPVTTLVPGDVVDLRAGDLVPADGLLLSARDFLVSQSSLTGESFPIEKSAEPTPADAALAARHNAVYLGTSVRSGAARMLVVRTGHATVFGDIASRLGQQPTETEFQRGVRHFGTLLVQVMVVMVVFVLVANHAMGRPVVESLLFAVALAVGISPELLPAIVAVTLAAGARQMASRGVLVRRLEAIEDLGGITTLCTDKTGTLTEGRMQVVSVLAPSGTDSTAARRLAWLNATLETGIGNPIDAALVEMGQTLGWASEAAAARERKIDEIPYDFTRRRLTVVTAAGDGTQHLLITKGAVAEVLAVCSHVARGEGWGTTPQEAADDAPMSAEQHDALMARFEALSRDGLRVLALARRWLPARASGRSAYSVADEAGLAFAGFITFADPPKAQAARTVQDLAALGVRTQVITGDNRHVAVHLAQALGLDLGADQSGVLTGAEMARLSTGALAQRAQRSTLFVEVDPQQKEQIVRALQLRGEVVAYLGDGINDAPALHAADVGISVDQAVDVARESADVVLLRPDLDVLRVGVVEGRRTFANTLKYIAITTSANFGNMVSMALVTPLLPFLPLAPKQILLNNFLSDLPSITISTDQVDAEQLGEAQCWDMPTVRRFMLVFGLISSVFDGLTFTLLLYGTPQDERHFQTAWFMVSVLTELAVLLVLRTRRPAWLSRPSLALALTSVLVGTLVLVLPWTGPLARLFGLTPLAPGLLAALLGLVAGYVAVTELAKRWFHRPGLAPQGASSPSR